MDILESKAKALEVFPDGRYLVSAGYDKVVRIWDLETGETVRTLRGQIGAGHEGKIYAMALSPDERWFAVGGFMGTFTVSQVKMKKHIKSASTTFPLAS